MISSALLACGLLGSPALAQDTPSPVPTEAASDRALHQALERIDALELRLEDAEGRLRDAEDWGRQPPPRSLTRTGGAVVVDADEVVREAVAFGGPVVVRGHVRGPAVSFGGDVQIHDGALVDGDAVSFGGEVQVHGDGEVHGDQVAIGPGGSDAWQPNLASPLGLGQALLRRLVLLLSFAGAGVLVVGLFPTHVDNIARSLREHPFRAGLAGVVMTAVGASLVVTLTLTLLGIPLAVLITCVLGLAWVLGFIGLCQTVGDTLPIRGVGARRWAAFLLGVLAIAFAGAMPFAGQFLLVTLGLFGAGAAVQTRLGTLEPA